MHTWYIGVYVQAVVFLALVLWIALKISKKSGMRNVLIVVTVISFIAFCLPNFSTSDKFYFFPFRLFEISMGCLIPYIPKIKMPSKTYELIGNLGIMVILFMLFSNVSVVGNVGLVVVVLLSCIVIWSHCYSEENYGVSECVYRIISIPGRYSYDVYIWHQAIIAFLYYAVFQSFDKNLLMLVLTLTAVFSFLSVFFRKKMKILSGIWKRILISVIMAAIGCFISWCIYANAGVVRNIPELGIDKANVHRNMHAEYVDIPYSWNVNFKDESKIHILVLGNSFGRDFANILNESEYSNRIEISYGDDISKKEKSIHEADFIFYAVNSWKIPSALKVIPSEKLYIVGNKSFGNSNGIIYVNRKSQGYFDQKVELPDDMILHNNAMRGIFQNHYIDMLTPLLDDDKKVRVFTDDHFYISQDCRHLTRYGAKYYARILDLSFIVK